MSVIMSGIEKIDTTTGGFLPGELVLMAGRPGMGKTTLLSRIVLNVAQQAVLDENSEFVLYFKQMSWQLRGVPHLRGIRNLQGKAVIEAYEPMLTIEDIVKSVKEQKKSRKLSVVAIDYLQLINTHELAECGRKEGATAIVSSLKQLAKAEKICILLTANLWRTVDKRRDHIPLLSDLAMIGDIEQLTDMVIFLHRPYHVVGMQGTLLEILPGPTTVTISKNRHGAIGSCELRVRNIRDDITA